MKFGITTSAAKYSDFIELKENEFKQILDARDNLFAVLFLEEKFDLISENYYEYETELLSIASRKMISHNDNYFSMSNERNTVGRRIINLMTTCRMYLDSINHHLSLLYAKDIGKLNLIENEKSNQYDNCFGYRVIEALRNHVQHKGIPIHNINFSYKRIYTGNESMLSHVAIPLINASALEEDSGFKKSVLKELKTIMIEDEIDIRPLIRDYVESIWKIHTLARKMISPDFDIWKNIINNNFKRFQKDSKMEAKVSRIKLVTINDQDRWDKTTYIFQDYITRIIDYQNKNSTFNFLTKCYASNEIRKDDSS